MTERTIRLTDIYTGAELMDETEMLGLAVCGNDFERDLRVTLLSASGLATLTHRDETVIELYEREATKSQRSLVKRKMKNFDEDRIVVVEGTDLIDGFHHVIAAHLLGRDVQVIDLCQDDPEDSPERP